MSRFTSFENKSYLEFNPLNVKLICASLELLHFHRSSIELKEIFT